MRVLGAAAIFGLLFSLGFACKVKKASELMLSVRTDVPVPKDLDSVTIRVLSFGGEQFSGTYEIGPHGLHLPGTLGVTGDSAHGPIDIEVTGSFAGKTRVLRRARTTLPPERIALLTLPLRLACFDKAPCGEGLTCVDGKCVDMTVPIEQLATLNEASLPQALPPGNPACFDLASCTASTSLTAVGGCTFSTAGLAPPFTLAIRRPATTAVGICDATHCDVPIDRDPTEGWQPAGPGSITLSAGTCAIATEPGASLIALTGCGEKSLDLPLCVSTRCPPGVCDVEWQIGCAPDQMCYSLAPGGAFCRPSGTAREGESCTGAQCERGTVCWHKTETDFQCVRWCCGDGVCPTGTTCQTFADGTGGCLPG